MGQTSFRDFLVGDIHRRLAELQRIIGFRHLLLECMISGRESGPWIPNRRGIYIPHAEQKQGPDSSPRSPLSILNWSTPPPAWHADIYPTCILL